MATTNRERSSSSTSWRLASLRALGEWKIALPLLCVVLLGGLLLVRRVLTPPASPLKLEKMTEKEILDLVQREVPLGSSPMEVKAWLGSKGLSIHTWMDKRGLESNLANAVRIDVHIPYPAMPGVTLVFIFDESGKLTKYIISHPMG